MCGILGSTQVKNFEKALELLNHRGPDNKSSYKIELSLPFIFGHTRLSINDLTTAGNQPRVSDCGNFILVFNGEIYNHNELKKLVADAEFKSSSDTETLFHLLIKYGANCVEKLNGIFAFAFCVLSQS